MHTKASSWGNSPHSGSYLHYLVWISSFSNDITFRHSSLGLPNSSLDLLEFLRHNHLLVGHLQFRDSRRGPVVGVPGYLPPRHQIPIGPSHFIGCLMLLLWLNCKSAHSQPYSKAPSTDSIRLTKYTVSIQGAGLNWKLCKMCIHPSALLRCYVVVFWQLQ